MTGGPNGAQSFALGRDIDATGTRLWNDGEGFVAIRGLVGAFDGVGHVIDGLTINRPGAGYQGLFYDTTNASLQNFGLTNVSIVGGQTTAGVAARMNAGSLSNVYVTGSVSGEGLNGALVGLADQVNFTNVTSSASVSGLDEVGGLVGRLRAGSMTNAYFTGAVSGRQGVGGLIGFTGLGYGNPIQGGILSSVYASGAVSGIADVGGLIGYAGTGTLAANAFWDATSTGRGAALGAGGAITATALSTANAYSQASYAGFDFTNTWFMIDGSTRPMLRSEYSTTLRTAHQVQLMAMNLGAAYILGNDIDMSATRSLSDVWRADRGFVPIAGSGALVFTGSLDGAGHVIDGLYIKSAGNARVGLIGSGNNATVRRLSLTNVSIDGGDGSQVGAVMGQQSGGAIEDVDVTGSVVGGNNTGGVVGYVSSNGTVSNARSAATVMNMGVAAYSAGGVVGYMSSGLVQGSLASGNVTARNYAGGLAGLMLGNIVDSAATGTVEGQIAGGLVGAISLGSVVQSYATGSVTAVQSGGGLVGVLSSGFISDAYAMGAVSGGGSAGGLVGQSDGTVQNSYATGYVYGSGVKGGLIGNATSGTGVVISSYWNTATSGQATSSGGGTALTTAQMQGILLPGFDPSIWSTGAGLYPYLQWQFAAGETPKAVSGTVTGAGGAVAGAGGSVIVASQGAQAGQGSIGANGYFYALTTSDAVDSNVLAYLHGTTQKGATFNDQGVTTNLTLSLGELAIDTTASSVSNTIAAISSAAGDLAASADLDFLGPLDGSVLAAGQNVNLRLTADTSSYLLDSDITAAGALSVATTGAFGVSGDIVLTGTQGLTLSGNTQWADASSLSLVAPQGLTLAGAIDAADGTFSIDARQDIALVGNTAINVDTYRQSGPGAWRQVGSSLPSFYARDFQLDTDSGASFLRALDGNGASDTPYRLFDVYGLQGIVAGGGAYTLANDIDASGTVNWNAGRGFVPIQAFDGSLDGNGHAIDSLTVADGTLAEAGLFASLTSAQISNLDLTRVRIDGGDAAGALAGSMAGGTIQNVNVTGQVAGSAGAIVGGLVGIATGNASISNAHVQATVSNGAFAGGLAGVVASATVTGSSAAGTVEGTEFVGGLVGTLLKEDGVTNPAHASITDSHATANVSGGLMTGGLVGHVDGGIISDTYATGTVTVSSPGALGAGGLVGYLENGSVADSHATGAVSTTPGVDVILGGLVGYALQSSITDTYATGNVAVSGNVFGYAGGLVGSLIDSMIDRSFANGDVSATVSSSLPPGSSSGVAAGGLVAVMESGSAIRGSYATGAVSGLSVTATDAVAGGLLGVMTGGTVLNAYATGAVSNAASSAGAYAGGLAGLVLDGSIGNAYATGGVSGAAAKGGLVGGVDALDPALPPSITASFWLDDGSGTDNGLGTRLTLAQFQDLSTFADAGWDIDDAGGTGKAWRIYEGHTGPLLRSFLTSVTVTADDASKTYDGQSYQLPFTYSRSDVSAVLQGTLGSDLTDADAGTYTIANGLYSGQTGYDITVQGGTLTIGKRSITVAADDQSRVYGDADPTFTYTVGGSGLVGGDTLTGALSTSATQASDVGSYGILLGTLGASGNYDITGFTGGTLTIGKRAISIAADDLSRDYGDANPGLTYTVGGRGLVNGDTLTGSLATLAGLTSNVGAYGITQGTLAASGNYDVTGFTAGTLTVGRRAITITADNTSRDYGDADPGFAYTVGGKGLVNGDALTGALASNATQASGVGSYGILQGTLAASGNYDITGFTGGTLTIGRRAISIAADDLSRDYGDANPGLTYTVGGKGLVNGDTLTGALATLAGLTSNVGAYGITQGTLAASGNYDITGFTGGTLTIGRRAISIAADDLSRDYGDANPALTYTVGGRGLVNGDTLTGSLATLAGLTSNVGGYGITQGTLAASGNYDVTGFTSGTLTIGRRAISIAADDLSRDYGDANPGLTYTVGGRGLVNGDTLTGALATLAGLTSNVGSYGITQGTLGASGNYDITGFTGGTLTIGKRAISIAADNLSRDYGDANPGLTYTVGGKGLVNGDTLTGALATLAGLTSNVGSYGITQGTLAASGNYDVTGFTGGTLTVGRRAITITADNASRDYGDADPGFAYTVGGRGLVNGDALTGALASNATQASGVGSYGILQGTLAASGNYDVTGFTAGTLSIVPRAIVVDAGGQTRVYGDANPALTYTVGGKGLVNGDTLSGQLATAAQQTSDVGSYGITQGTLAASPNYVLTYNGASLAVTPRTISAVVSADGKVYDATTAATGNVGLAGVLFGDAVSADGRFLFADINAGTGKRVDVSDIVLAGGKAGNYVLASNTAATSADIAPRVLVVTANGLSRQYGQANPLLTYLLGGQGLAGGDTLAGALATTAGERSGVGSYAITQGTLSASANYDVRYTGANLVVTPRPVTVTAGDQSRMTGQADPALTWMLSGGSLASWDSLDSVFSGLLARAAGDALGSYAIGQGTLAASGNYALAFVPGTFSILPGGLSQMPAQLLRTPFEDGSQPVIEAQEPAQQDADSQCGQGVAGGGVHPCNRALGGWLRISSR
ncbi:Immunoglobulin A1 protease precursor [Bordetella ansorpii]|uniref:Immunoglobulin A1 protease n=1 Tax=Bordetella ansorpii TaxID=288768 RepID=A0A157RMU0_9BORD|nr:Immunoglobulin A1 protease precursor [Bordetella ansorpii]